MQCREEKRAAGVNLAWQGLILRRNTSNRIADAAIGQFQSVVRPRCIDATREAKFDQRRIQKIARVIASEGPAGPVGSLQAGRQTNNQQRGIGTAE